MCQAKLMDMAAASCAAGCQQPDHVCSIGGRSCPCNALLKRQWQHLFLLGLFGLVMGASTVPMVSQSSVGSQHLLMDSWLPASAVLACLLCTASTETLAAGWGAVL